MVDILRNRVTAKLWNDNNNKDDEEAEGKNGTKRVQNNRNKNTEKRRNFSKKISVDSRSLTE